MLSVDEWWHLDDPAKVRLIEVVQCRHSDEPWYDNFFHCIKCEPHVLDAFVQRVNRQRLNGKNRIRHKYVVETMRDEGVIMRNGKAFNLDNNFTADIARLSALLFPELSGVFRFRTRAIGRKVA
ncbi:MAG: hypothetical protein MJA28_06355 [Gammaproteobacteria bacterium]|nr:hypothetical protein [Gammaproteobacteria bacterium]